MEKGLNKCSRAFSILHDSIIRALANGLSRVLPEGSDRTIADMGGRLSKPCERVSAYCKLVHHGWDAGGGKALLDAGQGIDDVSDPLFYLLLNSPDAYSLVAKELAHWPLFWTAGPTLSLLEHGPNELLFKHALPPNSTQCAHLSACGLQIAVLRRFGLRGLTVELPRALGRKRWAYGDDTGLTVEDPSRADVWHIRWSHFEPQRIQGLDDFLLAQISSAAPDGEAQTEADKDVAGRLHALVHDAPDEQWTAKRAAERLGMSVRNLQRKLAQLGTGFRIIVRQARIQRAYPLVRNTARPLTEIAYECGFSTPEQFSRMFRAAFGYPPSTVRTSR